MTGDDRALWISAKQDYTNALAIAVEAMEKHGAQPGDSTLAAIQAAAATILIHITKLRSEDRLHVKVPASTAPAAVARDVSPASSQAPAAVPGACPKCGGKVWDNRENKKNPKAPDWKCRDKNCVDDKGFVTGGWVEKKGKGANSKPVPAGSYDDMPEALNGDEDSLPF